MYSLHWDLTRIKNLLLSEYEGCKKTMVSPCYVFHNKTLISLEIEAIAYKMTAILDKFRPL